MAACSSGKKRILEALQQGTFASLARRKISFTSCRLAAIGLSAASFLSFPVAAFFAMSLMTIVMFSGTLTSAVEEGTVMGTDHETGRPVNPAMDAIMLPVFKGLLTIITLTKSFSPVDALSTGRSITWAMLAQAVVQIVFLLGGLFALFGIVVFTRRELATAQGTS